MSQSKGKLPSIIALGNIISALEAGSAFKTLDPISRAIVKFVGMQNHNGQEVGASEILSSLGSLASSVTLLNRISALDADGWIQKTPSGLHHRRKSITLTGKARREIARLSLSLDKTLADLAVAK